MCGRYTLTTEWGEVANEFGLPEPLGAAADLPPRYNVAPSQPVPVVALKADRVTRGLAMLRWGLVPYWSNDPTVGPRPINLKAETVAWKFGEHLRQKRCLVPADGFYEWKAEGRRKRPFRFTVDGGRVFAFAGLWDVWGDTPPKLATCCTLTTTPNDLVATVHDRMPVILTAEHFADWLDPATTDRRLRELMTAFPAGRMAVAEANPAVNKATVEGPECLAVGSGVK